MKTGYKPLPNPPAGRETEWLSSIRRICLISPISPICPIKTGRRVTA